MTATLTDEGHARLDTGPVDNVVKLSTLERIERFTRENLAAQAAKGDSGPDTSAELMQRRLDTVDLIVMGATIRQVAERHDISYIEARDDYFKGMAILNDRTAEAVVAMRDEVTTRQKALIRANMPAAMKGDEKAARIVQSADNMIAGLWGLRSARLEVTHKRDDTLASAMNEYRSQIVEAASQVR
jgi:hypothetical protein